MQKGRKKSTSLMVGGIAVILGERRKCWRGPPTTHIEGKAGGKNKQGGGNEGPPESWQEGRDTFTPDEDGRVMGRVGGKNPERRN